VSNVALLTVLFKATVHLISNYNQELFLYLKMNDDVVKLMVVQGSLSSDPLEV